MITPYSMRSFAQNCVQWAADQSDPSRRQTIVDEALTWLATAEVLEKYLEDGAELLPDLHVKLN
jgi:hypothetical protein